MFLDTSLQTLDTFNTAVISPVYNVMFTTFTIMASMIMFKATKETGALQAAKNKQEKQVEDLTWRLQVEKCMRADMEEVKTQENEKLQCALQEMQLQFKETKAMLMKEHEDAKEGSTTNHHQTGGCRLHVFIEVISSACFSLENGHHMGEESRDNESQSATPANKFGTEFDNKLRRIFLQESQSATPANKFEAESDNKLRIFLQVSQSATPVNKLGTESDNKLRRFNIERQHNQDNNDHMAYWLSNTSTLLFLLQQNLKSSGAAGAMPCRKPPPATSLFGRMTQGFRSSPSSANLAVAALDVAPRTSKGSVLRSFGQSFGNNSATSHWQSIIESLNALLSTLKENFMPPILVQKIFTQKFSYINLQLFNSLLLCRESCTFSNGEYVKAGLAELELWCCQSKEEYAGSSWDELKHIRQAVGFLVHHDFDLGFSSKWSSSMVVLASSTPVDWKRAESHFQHVLMTEDSNNPVSDSFLLGNNFSIPFLVDGVSNSLQERDFSDVKPAAELLENLAFQILHESGTQGRQ
ncbi:hypothetical protein HHK36_020354 [Tetracentron sinense]|uniref:Dilute domain-containing protein n=1 Tax=Tetracentron sinense TaxID=13715 RepID=A0A834YXF5_TETSI|nr:hypothetical protein HHK36_020354 [Tetracentron sinense]